MTSKTVSLLLISALLTGCGIPPHQDQPATTEKWKSYTNNRFGFRLTYPPSLVAGRDPENGAGKAFTSSDGDFEVLVQGHFVTEGQSLDRYYSENLASRKGTVTYSKKGSSWYVISGKNEKDFEYYEKFFVKDGNWVELYIVYPHGKAEIYDSWVETIEDSFVPFMEGNFDRPDGN